MKHIINEFLEFVDKNSKPVDEAYEKSYSLKDLEEYIKYFLEQYKGGWIPCKDRLPPKPKENPLELYLVSVNDEDYAFRAFWNGKFFADGFNKIENVMAWQPLPEPYEGST